MTQNKAGPLPSNYWIHNNGDRGEFIRLAKEKFNETLVGNYDYYLVNAQKKNNQYLDNCQDNRPDEVGYPVYTFDEWKALIDPPKEASTYVTDDYSVTTLQGKKVAIHCPTQELWNEAIALIPKCRLTKAQWKDYTGNSCFVYDNCNGSYSPISYWKHEQKYQIITAEEFIAANEKQHEYKVGDWVCILPDQMYGVVTEGIKAETPYKVKSLSGGCLYLEEATIEPLSDGRFRPATQQEIAKVTKPAQKSSQKINFEEDDWIYIISGGCRVGPGMRGHELERRVFQIEKVEYEYFDDGEFDAKVFLKGNHADTKFLKFTNGNTESYIRHATDKEIDRLRPKKEPVQQSDEWKVGDILPVEFLNQCITYHRLLDKKSGMTSEIDGVQWDSNRTVKHVNSSGWADISTSSWYLAPKHEYPEYESYLNKVQVTKEESQTIISKQQKTNQNDTSNKTKDKKGTEISITDTCYTSRKIRYTEGKALNLSGDQETIRTGARGKGTAVRS